MESWLSIVHLYIKYVNIKRMFLYSILNRFMLDYYALFLKGLHLFAPLKFDSIFPCFYLQRNEYFGCIILIPTRLLWCGLHMTGGRHKNVISGAKMSSRQGSHQLNLTFYFGNGYFNLGGLVTGGA